MAKLWLMRCVGCAFLMNLMMCIAACGPEPEVTPSRYPFLQPVAPLELESIERGVGVYHGEALAFVRHVPDNFTKAASAFEHAMLRVQSYDEFSQSFGEYTSYQLPMEDNPRGAADFINQPNLGDLIPRVGDLNMEMDSALAQVNATGLGKRSITVDFWRTRKDWWVRWDGLLTEEDNVKGKGVYGFGRAKMYDDMLSSLETIARTHKPVYMIVGSELELLFATDSNGGISPGEFSNFLSFYQEAVQKIKAASPKTKVGAGIHWDRFAKRVALNYARIEGEVDVEAIDAAFTEIMLPIISYSDVIALMSYAVPTTDPNPKSYYQFLRRLSRLYGVTKPVLWYSVGSPITAATSESQQSNYMTAFLDWTGGVRTEAIFWERMLNIDGSDTADQEVIGRCRAMTVDEHKGFELPKSRCFDGLFDSLFQPKAVWQVFKPKE